MSPWLALGAPEYVLEREQWVPRPLDEVFAFFLDPHNLARITPPWLDFTIIKVEPAEIRTGTLIDYRLKYFGVPYRWRTRIEDWQPGVQFVDTQIRGPYVLWHHTHTFKKVVGGVMMGDRVRYRLPFGPVGQAWHWLSVRGDLERIFDYRADRIAEFFSGGTVHTAAPQVAAAR